MISVGQLTFWSFVFAVIVCAITLDTRFSRNLGIDFGGQIIDRARNAISYAMQALAVRRGLRYYILHAFAYFVFFISANLVFLYTFDKNTVLSIMQFSLTDILLSAYVTVSAFIVCLISFRQSLFFIELIRDAKGLLGASYLLISDIFMSVFIFCVGIAFFGTIVSYKYPVLQDGTFIIYFHDKCSNGDCALETTRFSFDDSEWTLAL